MTPIQTHESLSQRLADSGLRATPQREVVYSVLLNKRDHPTADEVFARVKGELPTISLATVYNCLETLVECGLAKQVNVEREATRYCPNVTDHGHFICQSCGTVTDIPIAKEGKITQFLKVPARFSVNNSEITLRGICPDCKKSNN